VAECQRCGSKSQLFLCSQCTTRVHRNLIELPWWLNRLTEAAVGQTKMSDNGGRRSTPRTGVKGETLLAQCIEQFPNEREEDLEKARRQREKVALAHALSAGGVNARASELLASIADGLQYWVKDLCDSRGIQYQALRFRGTRFIGPLRMGEVRRPRPNAAGAEYALWLAEYVSAIASSEYAVDMVSDVEGFLEDITKRVNRPPEQRLCGPCPTIKEGGLRCDMQLRAPRDAVEVYCPACKNTHNVEQLEIRLFNEISEQLFTIPELAKVVLPKLGEAIPRSTLHYWLQKGHLKPAGYREDQVMVRLSEVRRCKLAMGKKYAKRAG
jgi:hypothetical protein